MAELARDLLAASKFLISKLVRSCDKALANVVPVSSLTIVLFLASRFIPLPYF